MDKKRKKAKRKKKITLKRKDRLNVGKDWVRNYAGENYLKSYKKRFNVDTLCALNELQLLGVELEPEYIKKVLQSEQGRIKDLQDRKLRRLEDIEKNELIECDEKFSFIAGYTSGGMPYGLLWEEHDYLDDEEEQPF